MTGAIAAGAICICIGVCSHDIGPVAIGVVLLLLAAVAWRTEGPS